MVDNYKDFLQEGDQEKLSRDKVLKRGVVHEIHLAEDAFRADQFINLSDTPAAYADQAGKFLIVNDEETALLFQLINASDVQPGTFPPGVYVFQGVVSGVTPTLPAHLATKEYVDLAINVEFDYFLTDTAHTIGGIYYEMHDQETGDAESSFSTGPLGGGSDQALVNFANISGEPGIHALQSGVFSCHLHAERTAGTRSVRIYWELYKRTDPGGVETLITTSEISDPVTSKTAFELHAATPTETDLDTTDILVLKFYANLGGGSPTTIVLYAEGTSDSHFTVPVESSIFNQIYLRQDGTTPLTANWNAGAYTITAGTFIGANVTSGVDPGHAHTVLSGGTGLSSITDHGILLGSGVGAITPMAVLGAGELIYGVTGADPAALGAGATTKILVGGGAAAPVWTTATGSGAPVRATSPTLVTPALGTPSSGALGSCTAYEGTAVKSTGEGGGTKFLREDGDNTCSWQAVSAGGGKVAQVITDTDTAQATVTTGFPNDDTLPQRDEGDERMSCTITPANASSTILIFVTINGHSNNDQHPIACLFRSDSMDALSVMIRSTGWNLPTKTMQWLESAGSTDARTYSVRVGAITGQDYYTNDYPSNLYSTGKKSTMSVLEILP